MKLRHPRAHPDVPGKPPAKIDVGGGYNSTRELNDDGTFAASREFGEGLADRFDVPFEVVDGSVPVADVSTSTDDSGGDTRDGSESDDGDEDGTDAPTCAGADGECSREVDEPGGLCWQHEED